MTSSAIERQRSAAMTRALEGLGDSIKRRVELARTIGYEIVKNGGVTTDHEVFLAAVTGSTKQAHAPSRLQRIITTETPYLRNAGDSVTLLTESNPYAIGRLDAFEGQPEGFDKYRYQLEQQTDGVLSGAFEVPLLNPLINPTQSPPGDMRHAHCYLVRGVQPVEAVVLVANYTTSRTAEGVDLKILHDRSLSVGDRAISAAMNEEATRGFVLKYVDKLTADHE